ncbi:hypothetical protein C8F04DRAFT_1112057, partial [Mycena alexandri]
MLRWAQLTSLTLEDLSTHTSETFTSDTVLEVLSRCPALQTCRLNVVEWGISSPVAASIVECPCLISLHLVCSGNLATLLRRIFKFLLVPQLRRFGFEGANPDLNTDSDSDFPSFLAASKDPTMCRLEITLAWDIAVSDDLLTLLTSSDVISPFCPALRELVIKQCRSSDDALMHCLKSRLSSEFCERLEDVEVWFAREMQFDILPGLQDFVDAGVRIALYYYPPQADSQFSPWLGLEEARLQLALEGARRSSP